MKTIHVLCVGLVIMMSPLVRADETSPAPRFTNATIEHTEQTMVQGLAYSNPYMTAAIAITVRDLKGLYPNQEFASLVIPLMGALKDEDAPVFSRTAAATALHELRSARGDYAIEEMTFLGSSERVKNVCMWLKYYRLIEKYPGLKVESTVRLSTPSAPLPFAENAFN